MPTPVWTLSVDLQTKTATFQSGMSDAAKAARGSFNEIKEGAREMGRETSYSMMEARHGIMLLGEEFGVHLPRGVTSFLATLGPVGAAMEAAFPFLAIAVGATFLIEKLLKIGETADKSSKEWAAISDETAKWGENSKKELLDVQIQIDKLNHDKLKELQDTLKKIDLTTLEHLKAEFDGVGKKSDEAFAKMRSNSVLTFLGMGNGVEGVQKMFAASMEKINADLASGDQKKLAADLKAAGDQMWNLAAPTYDLVQRLHEAHNELGASRMESDAYYQSLLKAHGIYASMTTEAAAQLKIEKEKDGLARDTITPIHNATDPRVAAERKKDLASFLETHKQKVEADEKLREERMTMESGVTRLMAEEYNKQVELAQRAVEQQHAANVRANDETVKDAESTRRISQLGLASGASSYLISKQQEQAGIRAILEKEQSDLEAAHQREIAEQQSFISQMSSVAASSSGKEKASALGQVAQAQDKLTSSARQYNEEIARTSAAIKAADTETLKLNSSWSLFFAKSNAETKTLATTFRTDLQSSMERATQAFSQGVAKSIVEGKSFGGVMQSVARQMAESMIQALVQWGLQDLITKMGMKATAASLAGANATASMAMAPFPLDTSAAAFGASMMGTALAFHDGGIVPGVGRGDIVPARLEPGEAVLPKRLTEGLQHEARFGSNGGGGEVHVHHSPTYHVNAIDGASVKGMLDKHSDAFERHFHGTLRKMNK
jgi:hypothetical protein